MAQQGAEALGETFSCSVCLNLLKEPVTIPCGHSYCMTCISSFWDGEAKRNVCSCPQCRDTFTPRPVLMKNTILAQAVEELSKNRPPDSPAAAQSYATAEDVACDICTGRKQKAFKSCLICLASYCKKHLQPHYESAAFKRHKLVDPSTSLQEKICSRHDEVMKIFCRTDRQCICFLCSMDEHRGHDTVSAAAESTERRKELPATRAGIQKNIEDREKDVMLLKQQVKSIKLSADQTVDHNEKVFTELIRLIQSRSSELKREVRSKQQTESNRVRALQEKLQQEIGELKKRDAELQQLSHTEDPVQFVHSYSSLSALNVSTRDILGEGPENCFEEVTAAVLKLRDHLHNILTEDWTNVYQSVGSVDVLASEPTSRAGFLKYLREFTLDPNTNHGVLILSGGNTTVTFGRHQRYAAYARKLNLQQKQILSTESLNGRCYLEVEWRGTQVHVAVTYKKNSSAWNDQDYPFGYNDYSWSLICTPYNYTFYHRSIPTPIQDPSSSRIGVYVDPKAGVLSFYSVTDTMTLLHRVNTAFTEPLHLGLQLNSNRDSAELCRLHTPLPVYNI